MTRAEAEQHARWLQGNHEERDTRRFVARDRGDGQWEVVSVELPEPVRRGALTPTIEAKPRPSPADDPRTGNERRLPGLPGGV